MLPPQNQLELEIRAFPTTDADFGAAVRAAIARSSVTIASGPRLLEAVERDLRLRYPRCVVHEQEPLGAIGGHPNRWYVYRDGTIA